MSLPAFMNIRSPVMLHTVRTSNLRLNRAPEPRTSCALVQISSEDGAIGSVRHAHETITKKRDQG